MVDVPPSVLWPVAIIAGGGIAGLAKGSTALIRAQTGVATAGLGNPVVSSAETLLATVVAALAIVLPLVCVIAVAALAVWAVRRLMRWRARRQA
jgi:hypothetical protein